MPSYQAFLIAVCSICVAFHVVPIIFFTIREPDVTSLSLYFWLTMQLLQGVVGAAIWGGENFASVWNGRGYCDLMAYLNASTMTGIVCAVFALALRLYLILKGTSMAQYSRKRRNLINGAICWICPAIQMVLAYLVMSERYVIARFNGCTAVLSPSWLSVFTTAFFPLLVSFMTMIMAGLTLFQYHKKRFDARDFVLCSSNNSCSLEQIWRTLAFCLICVFLEVPLAVVYVVGNSLFGHRGYDFDKVHSKAYRDVIYYFAHTTPIYSIWIYISMSFLLSVLIGVGSEILEMYLVIGSRIGFAGLIQRYRDRKEQKILEELQRESTPDRMSIPGTIELAYTNSSKEFALLEQSSPEKMDKAYLKESWV